MLTERLSIHQTFAQIGIQTTNASVQIHSQPAGDLKIKQPPGKLQIESPRGELQVNADAAWAALGKGPHMAWRNSIYSQLPQIANQAIAKIVEDGNTMGDLRNKQNPFAAIAFEKFMDRPDISYVGPASYTNVKINYVPRKPIIQYTPSKPEINYTPVKPSIEYQRGKVDVYLQQKNTIDIQVVPYKYL